MPVSNSVLCVSSSVVVGSMLLTTTGWLIESLLRHRNTAPPCTYHLEPQPQLEQPQLPQQLSQQPQPSQFWQHEPQLPQLDPPVLQLQFPL